MTPNPTMPLACLFLSLMLTGCSLTPKGKGDETPVPGPDPITEASVRIDEAREELSADTPGGGLERLEEVRIPVAEAWLDRPFRGRYRELRADHAIRALVRDRPMRLELEIGSTWEIPMVRPDPFARTVREHLDAVAAQADWSWRIDRGVVMVRDIETRRFDLSSQPGAWKSGLGLRNLNETGGSVADNGMDLELNPYGEEIAAQVRDVLGLGGAEDGAAAAAGISPGLPAEPERSVFHSGMPDPRTSVRVSPSGNLLTVTARPNAMREVEAQIRAFERAASRVVRIELSLIEVDFRDGERRDLALNLIRRSSGLPLNVLLGNSSASVLPGAGDASARVFGGSIVAEGGAAVGGALAEQGKRWTGSTAVAQGLDTLGDATIAFDRTVEIRNNRIASVDRTRTKQYLSKIIQKRDGDSGQLSTEVEFEDLRTGTVVHLQPTAGTDGEITLTLGLSRSALVATDLYNFGTVQGETHTTDDFNELLTISLRDGEPRLLASLSESETRSEKSRIPVFGRLGIGTSRNRSYRERDMVMMITATVVARSG